jgi:Xaa-Pro aminopeptidase
MITRGKMLGLLLLLFFTCSSLSAQGPEYYKKRRDTLLARLENAAALVPGAWEKDLETFRQSNNFYYLTGVEQPGLLLLLSPLARSPETLFLPARNISEGSLSEAWTGAKLGPGEETEKKTGVAKSVDRSTFETTFTGLAGNIDRLYFDYDPSPLEGPVSAGEVMLKKLRERYPHLEIRPLSRLTDSLRIIKDSGEIATLQKAVDITCRSLEETIRAIRPGMYEYGVEAMIEYGFHRLGSQRPGFPSIVGSGPNSAILHYNSNRRKIEQGELVLMDVGAELDYYTADITRTVPANGKFSPRQREIYQLVLKAQAAAIKAVRPQVTLKEVHAAARKVIEEAGYGEYFIHYTSHYLGMDVHDVGSRSRPLEPGMVITVEPGIYLAKESLGVRIEDDVLVTREGCRVLSSGLAKSVKEIESLMSSK